MIAAIIQARMGSTRLPRKTLEDICGQPMLARHVARAQRIPGVERVIVATTGKPADEAILRFAADHGLPACTGSEDDVLDRFYQTARRYDVSVIVRLSPDCPLLDPAISGRVLARFVESHGGVDYVSNTQPPTFPDGLDTEVLSFAALERAWREARLASDREHVTPYIWEPGNRFRRLNVENDRNLSDHRWTVDEAEDLEFVRAVYRHLGATAETAGMSEVLDLMTRHPELEAINRGIARNEGYAKSLRAERVLTDPRRA